eukprot:TRINITY_DN8958_c0_g1_i2.p1 TRINITY_DN8958_c0_g1~~TRINITY_DN8958_c0_g1_i2.p1  ORF type:complete len:364 (-),score=73.08 TRINITY_DN8958_c0_g1_i2:294-1385(-)
MSTLVCYMFYKNVMIVMTAFLWTVTYAGMSGQKFESEYSLQLFNAVWTFLPVLFLGVLDQQLPRKFSREIPRLYEVGLTQSAFGPKAMRHWGVTALVESVIVIYFCVYAMVNNGEDGSDIGLWTQGFVVMTAALTVANLKLFAHQWAWNWIQLAILWLSILIWWPLAWLGSSEVVQTNQFTAVMCEGQLGVLGYAVRLPAYWLAVVLSVATCCLLDMARAHFSRFFSLDLEYVVIEAYLHGKTEAQIAAAASAIPRKRLEFVENPAQEAGEESESVREALDDQTILTLTRNAEQITLTIHDHMRRTLGFEGQRAVPKATRDDGSWFSRSTKNLATLEDVQVEVDSVRPSNSVFTARNKDVPCG